MKNQFKAFAIVAVLVAATLSSVVFASTGNQLSIVNNTKENAGIVLVNQVTGPQVQIPVPGQGVFKGTVSSQVTSIVVNGVSVFPGTIRIVSLASGTLVKVNYSDPSGSPIIDPNIVN